MDKKDLWGEKMKTILGRGVLLERIINSTRVAWKNEIQSTGEKGKG